MKREFKTIKELVDFLEYYGYDKWFIKLELESAKFPVKIVNMLVPLQYEVWIEDYQGKTFLIEGNLTTLTKFYENRNRRLIEKLAEIEHEQWMHWSKAIAEKENISQETLNRWQKYWVPYNELPEDIKEL